MSNYPEEQGQGQQQYSLPSEKADLLDKIRPDQVVEEIFHKLLGERFINGKLGLKFHSYKVEPYL